ncbi:MAG: hypothetical protein OXG39_12230 [Chloroflexi bacterium]|nr:hypothetical protein [Chloroflexota bacterium]
MTWQEATAAAAEVHQRMAELTEADRRSGDPDEIAKVQAELQAILSLIEGVFHTVAVAQGG